MHIVLLGCKGHIPLPLVVDCGDPEAPVNGAYSCPATTYGAICTFSCNTGHTLGGWVSRTCQENGWDGAATSCTSVSRNLAIVVRSLLVLLCCMRWACCHAPCSLWLCCHQMMQTLIPFPAAICGNMWCILMGCGNPLLTQP